MNICYCGAVHNCSGYAQIRHLFLHLARRGHSVSLKPYSSNDHVNILYEEEIKSLEKNEIKKPYINIVSGIAPQLVLDHEASYNIAHSMFETTEIPERWAPLYNQFDEVWVPSSFCKRAFNRKDLNSCIHIVPFGIDENLYSFDVKTQNKMFTFLSVGQWIDRKGWDLLIKAYTSEFMGEYDVRLCIKTHNDQKTNEEMIREYLSDDVKNSTYMPRIMIKNQKVDEKCMPEFYKQADCFVLPSRGEAFALPVLEAMASGVPVITTDFGGQTDFVNEDNGWLIEVHQLRRLSERLCKINAGFSRLWFAEPHVKDIRTLMRYAFDNRKELVEKGLKARNHVLQNYTWDKVTDIAEARLNEIFKSIK
jgi:hypothetical protein